MNIESAMIVHSAQAKMSAALQAIEVRLTDVERLATRLSDIEKMTTMGTNNCVERKVRVPGVWHVVAFAPVPRDDEEYEECSDGSLMLIEYVEADSEEEARSIAMEVFIRQSLEDGDWESDHLQITSVLPHELTVWKRR